MINCVVFTFCFCFQMMWEQKCRVVIMATVENEAGRAKCHRYWPEVDTTNPYWKLEVKTVSETIHPKLGTVRKFNVTDVEVRTASYSRFVFVRISCFVCARSAVIFFFFS